MQKADALALSGSHFHACSAPSPQPNPVRLRFAPVRSQKPGPLPGPRSLSAAGRRERAHRDDPAPGKLEIHVASVAFRGSARGLRNRYRVGATTTAQEQATESATRTNQLLDDIPTRVEVLDREDIEERMLIRRGDIVMLLSELRRYARPGHVALARSRERPHSGMSGRYVRFLADGLPPFGQEVGRPGASRDPADGFGARPRLTAASSSVSKWWKACARAPALLRRARRRWSFLLLRKELLRIEVGRESDIEETDHHLFPALVAPRDGLGGIGVVRVVQ